MRLLKNGCNGGDQMQRGANPPILWRPSYIAYSPLFKFCPTPPISLSPPVTHPYLPPTPTPHPTVIYVVRFLCYFCCPVCYLFAILLNDNMDLHMLSLGTLVSEGQWCMFYATRHQVYRGLTHMFFYWYSNITYTHANSHSTLRGQ